MKNTTTVVQGRSQCPTGACQLGSGGRPANLVLVVWGGLGGVGGRDLYGASGYPGRALNFSARVLKFSTQPPTRVCNPFRSKNTALGLFRTPGGVVLGACFAL